MIFLSELYSKIVFFLLALKEKDIVKIATHTEGKHFMALTKDYEVYSWGNGDCGRLGNVSVPMNLLLLMKSQNNCNFVNIRYILLLFLQNPIYPLGCQIRHELIFLYTETSNNGSILHISCS